MAAATQDLNYDLLKSICEIPGIGGREDAVIAFVKDDRLATFPLTASGTSLASRTAAVAQR